MFFSHEKMTNRSRGFIFGGSVVLANLMWPTPESSSQTLPSGTIDAPPMVIGDSESIGANTTLNVYDAGVVGNFFKVGLINETTLNTELNISGGEVGRNLTVYSGGVVNMSGGIIGRTPSILRGAEFHLSGGTVGELFRARYDSIFSMSGGYLGKSATITTGNTVNISGGEIDSSLQISDGEVNITGGIIGNGFDAFTTVNMSGGVVGDQFTAKTGKRVYFSGGEIGSSFLASAGSRVEISGGRVGNRFAAASGSNVYITGGTVGEDMLALSGSNVYISGGEIGIDFRIGSQIDRAANVWMSGGAIDIRLSVLNGSSFRLSGGTVGGGLYAHSGSNVEIVGGDFRLNRSDYAGSTIDPSLGSGLFSGRLQDGSVFIFRDTDHLNNVKLTRVALPEINLDPIVIDSANHGMPSGLSSGQTLTLKEGGVLGMNYAVFDAELHIEGGHLGDNAELAYSTVNISGGTVGKQMRALLGSTVNITGGVIGSDYSANAYSDTHISGGVIGGAFRAHSGSDVNISGGEFTGRFLALDDSHVRFFGSAFYVDGVLIDGLALGETVSIDQRNVELAGVLADGSDFSFMLNTESNNQNPADLFREDALITITLTQVLGDYNLNGTVDAADYTVWADNFGSTTNLAADGNGNGIIDAADYTVWQDNFGAGNASALSLLPIPEPGTLALLGLGLPMMLRRRAAA
ncbi:PEP-CTERM sorting domain-containing protein [Algisphaera agarilytica]|uniref:PEP-CTERM protein-sorting domain-containing protein n=1 Tax=Algisphaera agarilytica TaxID=1385975 RepID=A0A7X0LKE8_9BACT|nr:PEP-CTERM sorting domain-containing protein [Algisphaera agarilytica]MBB6429842.1 hypothetical protein [Algisphaera agarilytica]